MQAWPFNGGDSSSCSGVDDVEGEALVEAGMGLGGTLSFVKAIYLSLRSVIFQRISPNALGGPIEIAKQAFTIAGLDWLDFVLFLAMISLQLAVLNFLPI